MRTPGNRLGIDFGTSNTVAMLADGDGVARPLFVDGSPVLPSAVWADPDGALLVGHDALYAGRTRPEALEPNPKQRIDHGTVLLGDRTVPVVDLIAAVLGRVRAEAGPLSGRVVLTCPVSWAARRRGILTAAASAAGLGDVRLVTEPVAASAFFVAGRAALAVGAHALVYDLGAGTFDASVVRRTADSFEVLANSGLPDAGGLDVDAAIVAHLGAGYAGRDADRWRRLVEPATSEEHRANRQFHTDVRTGKEMLSRSSGTTIPVPLFGTDAPLGREQLERLARPVFERTVAATRAAILDAGLLPADLAGLYLIGGASRTPLVATLLHTALGVAPVVVEQPELATVEGALLYTGPGVRTSLLAAGALLPAEARPDRHAGSSGGPRAVDSPGGRSPSEARPGSGAGAPDATADPAGTPETGGAPGRERPRPGGGRKPPSPVGDEAATGPADGATDTGQAARRAAGGAADTGQAARRAAGGAADTGQAARGAAPRRSAQGVRDAASTDHAPAPAEVPEDPTRAGPPVAGPTPPKTPRRVPAPASQGVPERGAAQLGAAVGPTAPPRAGAPDANLPETRNTAAPLPPVGPPAAGPNTLGPSGDPGPHAAPPPTGSGGENGAPPGAAVRPVVPVGTGPHPVADPPVPPAGWRRRLAVLSTAATVLVLTMVTGLAASDPRSAPERGADGTGLPATVVDRTSGPSTPGPTPTLGDQATATADTAAPTSPTDVGPGDGGVGRTTAPRQTAQQPQPQPNPPAPAPRVTSFTIDTIQATPFRYTGACPKAVSVDVYVQVIPSSYPITITYTLYSPNMKTFTPRTVTLTGPGYPLAWPTFTLTASASGDYAYPLEARLTSPNGMSTGYGSVNYKVTCV
ncbi:Hsp70 family protein [Longispora urticae]